MAKQTKTPDILEWTLTHAPDLFEDEASPPSSVEPPRPDPDGYPQPRRQISRRIWLLLGSLILGSVMGLALLTGWNQYRMMRAVEQFVALEEQAALVADRDRIEQLSDPTVSAWLLQRIDQAQSGQAAPVPVPALRAVSKAGVMQSFKMFAPAIAQADVARPFVTPDGTIVSFVWPQFYHYANGEWKRIPPPSAFWGEPKARPGPRVNLSYPTVDKALATELGTYLEDVLAQACAAWTCPDDLKFNIEFSVKASIANASPDFSYSAPGGSESLPFTLITADTSVRPNTTWTLPSPHGVGYPADPASTDLYRRALAAQILARAANSLALSYGGRDQSHNAFLYALVERMAVRLKLEPPKMAETYFANSVFTVDQLWGRSDDSTWDSPYAKHEAVSEALATLNRLLRDRPADTDIRLFQGLRSAADPITWLAEGLGISPEVAQARLKDIAENPYPVRVLATAPREFTLNCSDGPALFSRGDAQPTYFLSDYLPESHNASWSPDKRRLLVDDAGRSAVVDFASQTLTWLPLSNDSQAGNAQWASDTIVAYIALPLQNTGRLSLHFFDIANPERQFATMEGVEDYNLSPDKSLAAVVLSSASGNDSQLAFIPPLGGALTPLDNGAFPIWSPDGQKLLYLQSLGISFTLHVWDRATGETHQILDSNDLGGIVTFGFSPVTWSPSGEQIAIIWGDSSSSGYHSWVGIIRPDGSGLKKLVDQDALASLAGFSSDGKYLAINFHNRIEMQSTTIYDTTTGEQRLNLPSFLANEWSPASHQLLLNAYDGIYLLTEPGDPTRQPEKLTDGHCYTIQWNPKP